MSIKKIGLTLWLLPSALLALLALVEVGLRCAYGFAMWRTTEFPLLYERVYWPVPPWVHYMSIVYQDPQLGLWMKPNTERTYLDLFGPIGDLADVDRLFGQLVPKLPAWAVGRSVWHLRTNSLGIRGDELPPGKAPATFRVVALGDSWTVGVNVERAETFPERLARRLAAAAPTVRSEVINYGVIGGNSLTGMRLLPRVYALQPDVAIVSYAQNDEAAVRDEQHARAERLPGLASVAALAGSLITNSETYKLITYYWTREPGAIQTMIRQRIANPDLAAVNEARARCPHGLARRTIYAQRLDHMVEVLARRGVQVILLYDNVPDFPSHCTGVAMRQVAVERGVPFVDAAALLAARQAEIEHEDEARLGLTPASAAEAAPADVAAEVVSGDRAREPRRAVLRLDMSRVGAPRQPYVMGSGDELGDFQPNVLPLFDDGTHGDQRPHDDVWSREIALGESRKLVYLFTNGGRRGEWQGLENYRSRAFAIAEPSQGTVFLPIASFGRQALRSDPSHPDAEGYDLIAGALFEQIRPWLATRAAR